MRSSDFELICLLALCEAHFLTLREKEKLRARLRFASDSRGEDFALSFLSELDSEKISQIIGRKVNSSDWDKKDKIAKAKKSLKILRSFGIQAVFWGDVEYPPLLKEISDPPFSLFCRGNLKSLCNPCISIVGSRKAAVSSIKAAENFAFEAASGGNTIVSGLAFGIDAASHKGALRSALKGCGATVAVMPGGIDEIVPKMHAGIAAKIIESGGAIVGEYTPGTPAALWRFVQRNRLIAALSGATVVFQSPPASGALHTASFALDYNRELVFHESNFSEEAKMFSKTVRAKMKKSEAAKCMTAERFVEEGARVVSDFCDFMNKLSLPPENR